MKKKLHEKSYKHLTLSERTSIESGLNSKDSFRKIAREIDKGVSTIIREVKLRRVLNKGNSFNTSHSYELICPKTEKAPFVCNGCSSRKGCRKNKYFYRADDSHRDYRDILVDTRIGIDCECEEFNILNNIIKEDIGKGHSFNMIVVNHKEEITKSERTLYHYQEKGYLSTKNIDLPRKVRYKKRKKTGISREKRELALLNGRRYSDFKKNIEENNITYYVQMDTVIGKPGEECLLTFTFIGLAYFLSYKLKAKTKEEVSIKFKYLKETLGFELFHKIFPILLTDNGVEFFDILTIEDNGEDVLPTKLFFCEPGRSDQKGSLEVTHEYVRRYVEQGESFKFLTDELVILMNNNINSVPRKKQNQECGYDLFINKFGDTALKKLGLSRIEGKNIILNDKLFKEGKKLGSIE